MSNSMARPLFQLVEPVAVVTYMADEPTEAVMALGAGNVWDAYFAGRAAPLGRDSSDFMLPQIQRNCSTHPLTGKPLN